MMYHCVSYHQVSCIITIRRIEQVAGVRSSSVRVRVDVVVHNLEFCISDTRILKDKTSENAIMLDVTTTNYERPDEQQSFLQLEKFKLQADVVAQMKMKVCIYSVCLKSLHLHPHYVT